ncbi:Transcriptional regulator containing HTH domain,ArsR family [Halorhabdus sp. SVX81]|nr:Transcriptional regulator containing HTH domain,ArsR family [Halorhabdus sp. SVX81]
MKGCRSTPNGTPSPNGAVDHGDEPRPDTVPSGTILALLGDTYARRLLSLVVEQPRTGRELSAATDMSRPTIYRRLERLAEHGLVRTELEFDPDGHHRKRFHATVSEFDFDLGSDGIDVHPRTPDDERS